MARSVGLNELLGMGAAMKGHYNAITVWRWQDAPLALRHLSQNGGDEDWVAVVPPALAEAWIPWMDEGSSFGCCDVSEYPHPELPGYVVKIGSHA